MFNNRSDVILPHKMFTWTDFFFGGGGYIYPYTPLSLRPCLYAYRPIWWKREAMQNALTSYSLGAGPVFLARSTAIRPWNTLDTPARLKSFLLMSGGVTLYVLGAGTHDDRR